MNALCLKRCVRSDNKNGCQTNAREVNQEIPQILWNIMDLIVTKTAKIKIKSSNHTDSYEHINQLF